MSLGRDRDRGVFAAWLVELTVEFLAWALGVAIMIAVGSVVIAYAVLRGLWILFGPQPDGQYARLR